MENTIANIRILDVVGLNKIKICDICVCILLIDERETKKLNTLDCVFQIVLLFNVKVKIKTDKSFTLELCNAS
jgi:hypothetical protein